MVSKGFIMAYLPFSISLEQTNFSTAQDTCPSSAPNRPTTMARHADYSRNRCPFSQYRLYPPPRHDFLSGTRHTYMPIVVPAVIHIAKISL